VGALCPKCVGHRAGSTLLCCHVTVGHEAGIARSLILAECGVRDVDDRWPSDRTHRWNGTSRRSDPCHDTEPRCRAWSVRQFGGLLGIAGAGPRPHSSRLSSAGQYYSPGLISRRISIRSMPRLAVRRSGPKGQHRPLAPRARSCQRALPLDLAEVLEQIKRHPASDSDLVRRFPICASIRGSVNAARMPDIRLGDFTRSA
jgi:hypothetical protein